MPPTLTFTRLSGGAVALVTGLCVFRFDRAAARFALESVHPGVGTDKVRAAPGFDFDCPDAVPTTAAPAGDELDLRGPVRDEIAQLYPHFAAAAFGDRAAA